MFESVFSGFRVNGGRNLPSRGAIVVTLTLAAASAVGPVSAASVWPVAGHTWSDPGPSVTSAGLTPADIVVAVDESGSITPDKMDQEKAAATSILYDEFNPQSSVEVIGFGGHDSAVSDTNLESPTICPMTPLSTPVQRGSVETCISTLARRSDNQGNNTDFNAVINQAVTDLQKAPDGYQRLVFLLTDGKMDVGGDPQYKGANDDEARQLARATLSDRTIPAALQARVSVWGLGFGTDATLDDLTPMAQHSYQDQCAANHAQLVPDVSETRATLLAQFFAAARCAVFNKGKIERLFPGNKVDVPVVVPVIATSGAIEVLIGDPRDEVVFEDPQGHQAPTSGTVDGVRYELEGSGGVVQTLQVTNPPPGTWHIVINAPADSPDQSVSADVLWQGRLTSDIVVKGDTAPGQSVDVEVELVGSRAGALTADALKDVEVVAGMSGDGFDPVSAPLQADSRQPGVYYGHLSIPAAAKGALKFTGLVSGPGVAAQQNGTYLPVHLPGAGVVNARLIMNPGKVHPGDDYTATLQLENQTGKPHTLIVELRDAQAGVTLRQSTLPLSADSGVRRPTPLTIHVDKAVQPGRITGALTVIDADTELQYDSRFLPVDIVPLPGIVEKYGTWIALGLGLLVASILATAWAIRRRLRDTDVRDISMTLHDRYGDVYERLPAESVPSTRFHFGLVGVGEEGRGRLTRVADGAQWVARRRRTGLVLTSAGREPATLYTGDRIPLSEDINLGYEDHRVRQERTRLLDRLLGGGDSGTAAGPDGEPEAPEVV